MKTNNIRNHDIVYLSVNNVTMTAVIAIIAAINEQGYNANVTDLHEYDTDNERYALDIELHLTSRFHAFGHVTDWKRMRKACATVYSIVKKDLLERRYSSAAVSLTFYRDSDDAMIHHYTDYTVDYSVGGSEGNVKFVRLR